MKRRGEMRSPPRRLSPSLAKRRLRKTMRTLDALNGELRELEGHLSAPTPREYQQIAFGKRPSLEALLLGVLKVVEFHLAEASLVIEDHTPHSEAKFATARHVYIDDRVLKQLGREVEWRARASSAGATTRGSEE